ncbi:hypothetical protein [Bacillus wiedmannii]|uniref:hypothetical protein n=1 Tax=Bacillus wiedmannii TaxID=1890302 RepID=UPI000BF165FD|nr:hypothetical protein [Bacillus wiedmannii]PEN61630.1 hypothetical protein CN576_21610 [Bacillus wiedmannii]PHA62876.1 hypothetical protein COE75_16715 [Bacillus wiedmannii]
MFESFVITDHIMERYLKRVAKTKKDVVKRIRKDLHFSKVKQIINNGNVRHVFTFHSKEFIFVKDGSVWVLKTIIKRNRATNEEAIEKRKQLLSA